MFCLSPLSHSRITSECIDSLIHSFIHSLHWILSNRYSVHRFSSSSVRDRQMARPLAARIELVIDKAVSKVIAHMHTTGYNSRWVVF